MAIFEISEQFVSLEGEAQFTGHPTVYTRFARCNLSCPLFNNYQKKVTAKGYAELPFDIKAVTSLDDMPPILTGCDSQYAVNPEFSHIWKKLSTDELVDELVSLSPVGEAWVYPSGQAVIVSLTGGEPTLKWKFLPEVWNHPRMTNVRHYLVETNCAVPFKDEFIFQIGKWLEADKSRIWTWSNSPKLANSGHTRAEAIKPAIALMQYALKHNFPGQVNQYFKFVCDGTEEVYQEVKDVMEVYYEAGLPRDTPIYIMPEACDNQQQIAIAQGVAERCMREGWIFCWRLQNSVWENSVGK